jgi:hypothetical protein
MILYVSLKFTTDYRRPILLFLSTLETEIENHEKTLSQREKAKSPAFLLTMILLYGPCFPSAHDG